MSRGRSTAACTPRSSTGSTPGAKVIAYDVQFTEPTKPREDNALIEAVRNTRGRIVLATGDVTEYGETSVLGGTEQVEALGGRVGHTLMPRDADGVVRRLSREADGLPGLAVGTVEVARGVRCRARTSTPTGRRGSTSPARPGRSAPSRSRRSTRGRADPAAFRGAVVVVGAVAAEVQDVHPTAVGRERQMSGAELHANAIATLLADAPLRTAPDWLTPALIALFGLLVPLATIRFGPIAVVIVATVALVYIGLVQLAFRRA